MTLENVIRSKIKETQANISELEGLMEKIDPSSIVGDHRSLYRIRINENIKNIRMLEDILKEAGL